MTKRMLIDATQPEETRVVVIDGNRLEDVEFETAHRRQIKGNIYLGKVMRVEPSLQACFVDYGGNKHGFLAFGEVHPDYYDLPAEEIEEIEKEVDEIIENKKQAIPKTIGHMLIFSPLVDTPLKKKTETIIMPRPMPCNTPKDSFQKIGPAMAGMTIPYKLSSEVVAIEPFFIAKIIMLCKDNTITA